MKRAGGALLVVALGAAIWLGLRRAGESAEVVIGVEPGGRLTCRGRAATLRGVAAAVSADTAVVVRAAPEVPSAHVAMVLGVLEEQGVRNYRFAVDGDLLGATLHARYWEREIGDLVGGHAAGRTFVWIERDGTFCLGDRETRSARVLERWLRQAKADQERTLRIPPLAQVFPECRVPSRVAMRVLAALHRVGYPEVEWRGDMVHESLFDDLRLPPPSAFQHFSYWRQCACEPDFVPMQLPVARMAERDMSDEPHDRFIVQVDADGRLYAGGARVDLDGLEAHVRKRTRNYNLKMRASGKSGMEDGGGFSKLYVLVRAAAEASWEHVAWVRHVLFEQGIYKVQFAVRWTEDHACRRWSLDGKLQAFLPPAPPAARGHVLTLTILADGQVRFRGRETGNLAELERWIRGEHLPELTRAVVRVDRALAHGRVVAVADRLHAAAICKIDFVGVGPPPEAVRRLERLPR